MKQITVYGLLGKIKNGNIPNKIRFDGNVYEYHNKEHGYCRHVYDNTYVCLNSEYYLFDILNDEVEIIEEDNKIEKLVLDYAPDIEEKIFYDNGDKPNHCIVRDAGSELIIKKINQLIDVINEMKKGR